MSKHQEYFDKLSKRFWEEFSIPTQDEDISVDFANPSDIVKSLVKSRNWMGTLSENMIRLDQALHREQRICNLLEHQLQDLVVKVLARNFPIPGAAIKNKETQEAFIVNNSSEEESFIFESLRKDRREILNTTDDLKQLKNSFEIMKKSLEKTTDWLVQYLNWHKFEIRERV